MRQRVLAWTLLLLAALCRPLAAQECPRPAASPAAEPDPGRLPERLARVGEELSRKSYGVVTLGDSIMQGWPTPMLEQAFGTTVVNAGFGREHPEHVLWRLDALDFSQQKPRYVLILIGTNGLGRPACQVYWSVRAVIEKAQQKFPGARVIDVSILPRGENLEGHDAEIVSIDHMLAAAAPTAGYAFLNAHDDFTCEHRTPCDLYVTKQVHLSRTGYELLTRRLTELLATERR